MFNDLNNNTQNRQTVDDIFAETDKAAATPANGVAPEISAQRVGLAVDEAGANVEEPVSTGQSDKWFKIIIIVIVSLIVLLGGYLAYSKFLANDVPAPADTNVVADTNTDTNTAGDNVIATTTQDVADANNNNDEVLATTTDTGLGDLATSTASSTVPVVVDSDSDGLTDAEEALEGSNPLLADTDADGLGDYEEVKIYKTDSLNPDTDSDTYLDGAEVKSGYNPLGEGKLPGAAPLNN